MTKKISLPSVFSLMHSSIFLFFFSFSPGAGLAQNQVHDSRLPPILPGQTIENQVIITTAGGVVDAKDELPRVPTDRAAEQKLPPGLMIDARKDYLDAAKQGAYNGGQGTRRISPPGNLADVNDSIPLPSLPTAPEVK